MSLCQVLFGGRQRQISSSSSHVDSMDSLASLSPSVPIIYCSWQVVVYWPLTQPSIKRCTCANKRKKKRKQEGIMKECWQVSAEVVLVGDRKARVRASLQTEGCGPQQPPVEQPWARCGRSTAIIFTNPSARAGYDTRSIFKRSLTGLNSEFSFS